MDDHRETSPPDFFVSPVSSEQISRERTKARDLRATRWWKQKLSKGACDYCGGKFKPSALTMDHVVPLVRGGRSVRNNLVTACRPCNQRKKNKLLMEWEKEK